MWRSQDRVSIKEAMEILDNMQARCYHFDSRCYHFDSYDGEAVDLAIAALKEWETVNGPVLPLSIKELKELHYYEWVWVEIIDKKYLKAIESSYYRVHSNDFSPEDFCCGYSIFSMNLEFKEYGKTWLAYRKKPKE